MLLKPRGDWYSITELFYSGVNKSLVICMNLLASHTLVQRHIYLLFNIQRVGWLLSHTMGRTQFFCIFLPITSMHKLLFVMVNIERLNSWKLFWLKFDFMCIYKNFDLLAWKSPIRSEDSHSKLHMTIYFSWHEC